MRLTTTVTDITPAQWDLVQKVLKTQYEIRENASRVCLVLQYQGEERHVEMPLGDFTTLMAQLSMVNVTASYLRVAAALSPDELPDRVEDLRNLADPARSVVRNPGVNK